MLLIRCWLLLSLWDSVIVPLLYINSSVAFILMGKRELFALLSLASWCLVTVVWLFHAVPWISLQFVIVVFPDHTNLQFSELIVKYNVSLSTLLQQGIIESVVYADWVYKVKRMVGKPSFSAQFKTIIKFFNRVGYNMYILPQSHSEWLVSKPYYGLKVWFPLEASD